jgi:hypothetical protein
MNTIKNVLIILGAPGLFIALVAVGYAVFYAEAPGALLGYAVLGGASVYFGFRRIFSAMWLYAAAFLLFLVVYPKLSGLESYSREGMMRGRLSMLRQQIMLTYSETGAWPADASGLLADGFELREGHKTPREVRTFTFPRACYLWPPEGVSGTLNVWALEKGAPQEEAIRWSWNAKAADPLFLYPGKEFEYRVTRDKSGEVVMRGSIAVPVPEGFTADSGALIYDPSTGYIFINCVHKTRQKSYASWWAN